ncbi:lysophospholipid acyltransferase family protein [Candidatus Pelagibacter sp. HIMB1509]|uniref:lysophospholipid acyltransferase family protein n=1 Tax=Candidatus Pelagibacter sp. HIMB1509 TaxID=3413339 RepID=UPI003F8580C2
MKYLNYFIQFIFVITAFTLFKICGLKKSSLIGGKIFEKIGPLFRSKKIIHKNIKRALPDLNYENLETMTKLMWNNYGRTFAEYIFLRDFRIGKFSSNVEIEGKEVLEEIKKNNQQVVFVSGHLSNFELMAMFLEKNGINLLAIYRPLNNLFLNPIMEKIRRKYICKYQIKKGIGGIRDLIKYKKQNFSTALMIDQRVSEGILSPFFKQKAFTTTIPAQLVKKFNAPVVPVYIERIKDITFKITIKNPIFFHKEKSIENITDELNLELEKLILKKPEQWIWSHNRWK